MNLASILNTATTTPAQPGVMPGAAPADGAMLAEFAALLGLTVEAASTGKDLPVEGGNALPELPLDLSVAMPAAVPVLVPVLVLALPQSHAPVPEQPAAEALPPPATSAPMLLRGPVPSAAPPASAATPEVLRPSAPAPQPGFSLDLDLQAGLKQAPAAIQTAALVQAQVQAQVVPQPSPAEQPQAGAQQLAAQPLAALPLVAQPPSRRLAEAVTAAPTPLVAEVSDMLPETARPVLTVAPVATPLLADPPRVAVADPLAPTITAAPVAERHDFSAIVDRLTEARELAQPGRAAMQLAHRDFGSVSVQFDMAGSSLKVALASPDAGFAPAVEAALTDRPIATLADAARTDTQGQRSDQALPPSAAGSSGPAAQNDGQRPDQNARQSTPRNPTELVQRQPSAAREDDAATAASRARDGNLFA